MAISSPAIPPHLLLFAVLLISSGYVAGGATFGVELHHRFSDRVRRWAESRHPDAVGWRWPVKGSPEYYGALAAHDSVRGRGLGVAYTGLTFADGNATLELSQLGFLYYTSISLGTPNVTFLVALDTGSNLLWLPCECKSCASLSSRKYGFNDDFEFRTYSRNMSSTSKNVSCDSRYCELQSKCSGATSECPYIVAYSDGNTSSSGQLVTDILYLIAEGARPEIVEARIVFGCGQVQTGSLLGGGAPDGLLGLGINSISVPSILSSELSEGLNSNSFSLCFNYKDVGRIEFGDKGSSDQQETPFNISQLHPAYDIDITGIAVGNASIDTSFSALVDSGTSFTSLADPIYTLLSKSFNSQVKDMRSATDPNIPFEYCYNVSPNQTGILTPILHLTMKGGGKYAVSEPIILVSTQKLQYLYCLAILRSSRRNIIGQNFMTGLRLVFDRERLVLGWKTSNCFDRTGPYPGNHSAPPPAVAETPLSSHTPTPTSTPNPVALHPSSPGSHALTLKPYKSFVLVLFLLSLPIF